MSSWSDSSGRDAEHDADPDDAETPEHEVSGAGTRDTRSREDASKLVDLDPAVLARLGVLRGTRALLPARAVLSLDWPELERVLPDHGLPRGVVELAAPVTITKTSPNSNGVSGASIARMGGGATTIALAAMRAVHQASDRPGAVCAWVTPVGTPPLYAPAVVQAGVDLERLVVVRPQPAALARTIVKIAASGAFDLVVVDALSGLDGRLGEKSRTNARTRLTRVDGALIVRKLALAAEERGTTFVLLTDAYAARRSPWPVALRIEVERRPEAIAIRVTKDRRGSSTSQHVVRIAS